MENPGAFVVFYMDAVEIKFESEKAGRPIFRDMPHIRKIVPGDNTNIVEVVAKDFHKQQFPKQWEAFERSMAQGHEGTPLEQWPQVTRAQVKEAKYFEVHTVEQMAQLSDAHCQKLGMGFQDLRNKAKAYLEAASGIAAQTAQAAENQRLKDEMAALKAQFAEMNARSEEKRSPGRPRKETAEA